MTDLDLRRAMGHFATGVTVVSTRHADGTPLGTTASAVASVSLAPPLVLVCLARTSLTLSALRDHGAFALNVLAAGQSELALAFARPGPCEAWGDGPPRATPSSVPIVDGALAVLDCAVHDLLDGGDHEIVLGRVRATEVAPDDRDALVAFRSRLESLAAA